MLKKNIENIYPLSPQQQGMLYESLYGSEVGIKGAHVEQFTCTLRGALDVEAFKQAWQQVAARHSILRTAFVWKEQAEPLQVMLRHVEVPFECRDWRALAPDEQQSRLQSFLAAERERGFELTTAPLIRVTVFRVRDDVYQLVWTFHHMILDGWSHTLMLQDLFPLYAALSKGQPVSHNSGRSYRDYIAWLKKQDISETKRYWQEMLGGFDEPTPLGEAAPVANSLAQEQLYGYHFADIEPAKTKALQTWAQRQYVTLGTLFQGAWALLLSRYSGRDNVVFGTTTSGRPPDLDGVESILGLFISTLPLRVAVPPQAKLGPWIKELQKRQLDLQYYGYCSAGQIHQWSSMPGALPLYESLLVFENYPTDFSSLQSSGLAFEIGDTQTLGAQTNHALTLLATVGSDVRLQLVHHRQRICDDDIPTILQHLVDVLENIAGDPERPLAALLDRIPKDQTPRVRSFSKIEQDDSADTFVAPRTPTEETLARIWTEVLGVAKIDIHKTFFEIGGYSLLATEVVSRTSAAFEIDLSLRSLFENPTVAELAVIVAQKQAEKADQEVLEQILVELEQS